MRVIFLILFFNGSLLSAQQMVTLNGEISDAANGESLIGAVVYIKQLGEGAVTNVYGFYSLSVPSGTYDVEFRYIGFNTQKRVLTLTDNTRLDIELVEIEKELNAVVVSANREDANISDVEMSTAKLDIKSILKVPTFAGEVDIIKSIQLLPGVSTVGEGASGFNVRGGGAGQNLVLLDEAPVYQTSHLFGFFSVFNPIKVMNLMEVLELFLVDSQWRARSKKRKHPLFWQGEGLTWMYWPDPLRMFLTTELLCISMI